MFVMLRAAEGLLISHLCLATWFLVGASFYPWFETNATDASSKTMVKVVCTCALGISLFGFAVLALAFFGLLWPASLIATPVLLIGIGAWTRRESPFAASYWVARVKALSMGWDASTLIVYYVMIVLALPAIILNFGGSDPVAYHLAYANDWSHAHRLTIDPFLRTPFYASNFVLLFAAFIELHMRELVNFLTWSMSLLSALAICASAKNSLEQRTGRGLASLIGVALALSVVLAPFYLRWNDTAYIDVSIGAFALMATLCFMLSASERETGWLFTGSVVAGFLIGMKGSFATLAPVFLVASFLAGKGAKFDGRRIAAAVVLLVVCASPWYVRNLIEAGDPAPPVFNMMLHGRDAFVSKSELQAYAADLFTKRSPRDLASLPLRAFFKPLTRDFREYGTCAVMLLLFAPAALWLVLYGLGKPVGTDVTVSVWVVTMLIAYWFLTSTLLRYGLIFYPLLPVALAAAVGAALRSISPSVARRYAAPCITAIAIALVLPSPPSHEYYLEIYNSHYRFLPSSYTSDEAYLGRFSPGYIEAQTAISTYEQRRLHGRVYVLSVPLASFFRSKNIVSMGDWGGPAGYYRLYRAVDARRAADFLSALGTGEALINRDMVMPGLYEPLREQLIAAGYEEVNIPQSSFRLFVDPKMANAPA